MKFRILYFIILLSISINCDTTSDSSNEQTPISQMIMDIEKKTSYSLLDSTATLAYDFDNPTRILPLPGKLMEISGLSYHATKNQLLAVHDEKGLIYYLNKETCLLYTSPSPRDQRGSRMPSSA